MSSLLKEDMEKKLFKPQGHTLYEFIETKSKHKERFYLCTSGRTRLVEESNSFFCSFQSHCPEVLHAVAKGEEVYISLVKHYRACLDEKYEVSEMWFLRDLQFIDGKEADTDNPHFDMMFDEVCNVEAYSCASKYAFARSLIKLNTQYTKRDIKVNNFDSSYIEDGVIWSSNNGDCLVLMRICFYASNLLCLSLCPIP
ncbi:exocyst complex component 1-like [Pyxicephalus adspersus]|uniref:exocyst complex component 1-like n=1 Tax=Pyxicephalus adspersus TaxID=30357 RepID=UPI003B5B0695